MSTTKNEVEQVFAKLVRGTQYVFRAPGTQRGSAARVFVKGKWEPVTEAEREHLVTNAVDYVTVSGGGEERPSTEERQKFQFRRGPLDEPKTEAEDAPRSRRRSR